MILYKLISLSCLKNMPLISKNIVKYKIFRDFVYEIISKPKTLSSNRNRPSTIWVQIGLKLQYFKWLSEIQNFQKWRIVARNIRRNRCGGKLERKNGWLFNRLQLYLWRTFKQGKSNPQTCPIGEKCSNVCTIFDI